MTLLDNKVVRLVVKYKILILFFLSLTIVYFLTRLINLTIIPVFVDEAIYTHWSQIILSDQSQWFIPLSDGKQPLFMWLGTLPQRWITDPLFAQRLISVLAGFVSMIGVWFLAKELFNQRMAGIASGLYILCPFLMMYDRLAVPDGLLTTFFIWTVYLLVLLSRYIRLDHSLILGWVIGGGLLTKSTVALALIFLPFSLILFDFKRPQIWSRLFKLIVLWIIALGSGFLLYSILRLSPLYYLIAQRTPDFIFTPLEVLKHPYDPFVFRIPEVTRWLGEYLTWPIFLLGLIGAWWMIARSWREGLFLVVFFLAPLLIEMEIAKGFTPRYFIFVSPLALVPGAYFIDKVWKKLIDIKTLVLVILFIPAVLFEYFLLTKPEKAPIPSKEKDGYLEEWSAGFGIKEVAQFLKEREKNGQSITVGTEGTQGYGTLPDGLQIYLWKNKNIIVVGMGQRASIYNVPTDLVTDAKTHQSFLVVNKNRFYDKGNPALELIASYPKSNDGNPLLLYKIHAIFRLQKNGKS